MRNFFNNTFSVQKKTVTNRQIAALLGTNEKKIINRYKASLDYINMVKEELLQRSRELVIRKKYLPAKQTGIIIH